MKNNFAIMLAVALFAMAAFPAQFMAQEHLGNRSSRNHHRHYRVIDTGSFGGPSSHMTLGAHILNNNGIFTGYADTTETDPYAPDECWDGNCLVAHSFRWNHGQLNELGVIDSGPNSESNWLSENGLIAGDSQNGLLDPLVGFWEIRGVLWRGTEALDVRPVLLIPCDESAPESCVDSSSLNAVPGIAPSFGLAARPLRPSQRMSTVLLRPLRR